jgi:hypothetical protein
MFARIFHHLWLAGQLLLLGMNAVLGRNKLGTSQ